MLVAIAFVSAPALASRTAAAPASAGGCVLPEGGSMGRLDWETFVRPLGTVRAVMLFVDFPDVPAKQPAAPIFEDLGFGNAARWLGQSSYGKVALAIEPIRQWVRMPQPLSAYRRVNGALVKDEARRYSADAIAAADPVVDFSQAEIVYILPNREATAYARSSEHDYPPEEGFIADGRVVRATVTFGTAAYERGFRTLAHETGHAFGTYDYYNAFGHPTDRYAGAWSLMADSITGGDHFAWDKWRMGWLSDAQVRCVTAASTAEYVLSPVETRGGVKAVILRTGLHTAVIAEFRTRQGLDAGMCSSGVLIYKVNNALEGGAGPVRVSDARPRSASSGRTCRAELDDAAYRPGGRWTDSNSGTAINVTYIGRAARIRVARAKTFTPPAVHERSIAATLGPAPTGGVTLSAVLAATDGFTACAAGRPLTLQEFRLGEWWTVRTANTDVAGGWTHAWTPTPGATYRLRAPQRVSGADECALAESETLTVR
jgi:M6 family metalloprotease-like protein